MFTNICMILIHGHSFLAIERIIKSYFITSVFDELLIFYESE